MRTPPRADHSFVSLGGPEADALPGCSNLILTTSLPSLQAQWRRGSGWRRWRRRSACATASCAAATWPRPRRSRHSWTLWVRLEQQLSALFHVLAMCTDIPCCLQAAKVRPLLLMQLERRCCCSLTGSYWRRRSGEHTGGAGDALLGRVGGGGAGARRVECRLLRRHPALPRPGGGGARRYSACARGHI